MKRNSFISLGLFLGALVSLSVALWVATSYSDLVWRAVDGLVQTLAFHLKRDSLTPVMTFLSWWGKYGTEIVWLGLGIPLLVKRKWPHLILVAVLSLGGTGFGLGLQAWFHRVRPTIQATYGMPSNHVLTSTILFLFISYFFYSRYRFFGKSLAIFTAGLLLTMAIGVSRLYFDVHYFSDIVAGFLFGLGFFLGSLSLYKLKY